MDLLTLDLGVTTGWAWLRIYDPVNRYFTIENYGDIPVATLLDSLQALTSYGKPDVVLMEKPLLTYPGRLQNQLRIAVSAAETVFPTHEIVTPSQWKPSPYSSYPLPSGSSQHSRDAVRMGVWWLKSAWVPDTTTS